MHRRLALPAVLLLIVAKLSLFSSSAHAAGAVNAWITFGSTSPGVGCSVDVGFEVRSGGNPVSGVTAEIALFDSGDNLISKDAEDTDADGIAHLSFDTTDTSAGESDWIDIDLDGTYLKGFTIVPTADGGCNDEQKMITASAELDISLGGDSSGSGAPDYPTHQQEHSLSCEYASLQIATTALGDPVPEDTFIPLISSSENPHKGYRGDIDGPVGSTDDYGVYAEPLVDALSQVGFNGEVVYGGDTGQLESELDAGDPVLVWISTHEDPGFYDTDSDGDSYKLVPWEHVVVIYGYDDAGVWASDPGNGTLEHFTWDWFEDVWDIMDGMSLVVSQ